MTRRRTATATAPTSPPPSPAVFATTASVDFGAIESGQAPGPVSRQVTYVNLSDADVTLTLTPTLRATGGPPVPGGALTSDPTVTVPAGGTASGTVTLDAAALPLGRYAGTVTAVDESAGVQVRMPVGLVRQPPKTTLTVRTIGLDGEPSGPQLTGRCTVGGDGLIQAGRAGPSRSTSR